jgi:hypothetical protein
MRFRQNIYTAEMTAPFHPLEIYRERNGTTLRFCRLCQMQCEWLRQRHDGITIGYHRGSVGKAGDRENEREWPVVKIHTSVWHKN